MGLIDAGFMGKCHARAQEQPNQLHWTPLNAPTQTPERGGHGLSAAADRASRVTIGHPEGMPLAFANIYADFAEAIRADRAGRARSAGAGLSERRGRAPLLAGRPCRGGVGPRTGGRGSTCDGALRRRTAVWPARARRGATYENETPATAGHSSMGGGTGPGPPPMTDWSRSRNAPVIIPDSSDAR